MPVLNPSLAQGKRKFLFRLFCQVGQALLQGSGKSILTGIADEGCYSFGWRLLQTWQSQPAIGREFWESNFLCVYTLLLPYLLKFDSRKAAFWLEMAVLGIKFYKCIIVFTFCFYHTSWNLIPVKLLFGSKGPFWESQFLCVYICLLPYLLRFDSRKAAFWLERAVLGIKFPMCIHSPSTYLLKFDPRKASFWLKRAVLGIKFPL